MAYATKEDYRRAFTADETRQIAGRDCDYGDLAIVGALAEAGARIDTFLARRYALPVSVAVPALTRPCLHIARYYLYKDGLDDDSDVLRRYRDELEWLQDIADGHVALSDSTGLPLPPADGATGAASARPYAPLRTLAFGPAFEDRFGRAIDGLPPTS